MEPNLARIKSLMRQNGWSSNELARRAGLSKSEVSRFLRGKRSGGNKMISGLLRAFNGETLNSLFILPDLSPIVNANSIIVPYEEAWTDAKHPKASILSCRYCEANGLIEIVKGNNVTTLHVPPGEITTEYSTKE